MAAASTSMQGCHWLALTGTRTEADQIAKLVKGAGGQADVWLDLNASEDNIQTRDVNKYRVIHIATTDSGRRSSTIYRRRVVTDRE